MAEQNKCVFCNIVNGKTDTEFLHQDDVVVVFKDINPHYPVHDLIVPRRHIRSVNDLTDSDADVVAHMIFVGRQMAEKRGVAQSGYKLLFNVEYGGGQRIFHLHMHLLGGFDRK
ncbi:MAG TPA: HIT domain-containing protein [Desulfobacterales bacterium]